MGLVAGVTSGEIVMLLTENQSTYPLGEDGIVRFADFYVRSKA